MIYLDNAATSFPKPIRVIQEVEQCLRHYCGNPGRSSHSLSLAAAEKIYEAREKLASFLGAPSAENICFTSNATHALNIAIKGLVKPGAHVIISDMEHNSVLRPIHKLTKTKDVSYSVFNSDNDLFSELCPLVKKNTQYIISSISSNVTGKRIELGELYRCASKLNLKLIVDASQYVGHYPINLSEAPIDALCAPGHKALFGIQGSGFVVLGDCRCDTLLEGGNGADSKNPEMPHFSPERYEAGTLSTPSIVSLSAGIDFLLEYGIKEIEARIDYLSSIAKERLETLDGIKLYGAEGGIISFNLSDIPSSEVARLLDKWGICVRGGLHCSPLIHKKLGTQDTGIVRASLSVMNTLSDIDALYYALKRINR